MSNFIYFAYGSNMLTSRLVARCKSAKVIGIAYVDGYKLAFLKQSLDGSGKGTLVPTQGATTYGVLYQISNDEKKILDGFEGKDYLCHSDFPVIRFDDAKAIAATTYVAKAFTPGLVPYDWYAALVLAGAREHGLVVHAPDFLSEVTWKNDAEEVRQTRSDALGLLKAIGIDDPIVYLTDHVTSIESLFSKPNNEGMSARAVAPIASKLEHKTTIEAAK